MARLLIAFGIVAALLATGCVPVTEPLGDVTKAEPDKKLVGKWSVTRSNGLAGMLNTTSLSIDVPNVKGNPKGLMRDAGGDRDPLWFYLTTVGKHAYATVIMNASGNPPQFDKEGAFEEWKKSESRRYFVFKYTLDGDKLTIDCGNLDTFKELMKENKINDDGDKNFPHFNTPAGWLAKHLDKNDPAKIFDGTNTLELKRDKK